MRYVGICLCFVMAGVYAPSSFSEDDLWFSEIALGAVATSGNTEERNIKVRLDSTRDNSLTRYKQKFHLNVLNNNKDEEVTAQKFYGAYELAYKLDGNDSIFGRVSYEDDRFNGFDYQADVTVGYNREMMSNESQVLNLNAGIGARFSEFELGGKEEELIVRLGGDFTWKVSANAVFMQSVSAEIGSDSTISRSETALSSDIVGNLAMKLALNIKHQSEVPFGNDKTDTETSMTVVYKF
ncbi:MAG: putative salt-induced outer membrane protein [Candidatus Azotimanducaceae bacterium]|jgi:putative salt-induced outer membrane protein